MTALYEKLGAATVVDAAVDKFYEKMLADARMNHFFNDIDKPGTWRARRRDSGSGGPCEVDPQRRAQSYSRIGAPSADVQHTGGSCPDAWGRRNGASARSDTLPGQSGSDPSRRRNVAHARDLALRWDATAGDKTTIRRFKFSSVLAVSRSNVLTICVPDRDSRRAQKPLEVVTINDLVFPL